MIIIAKIVDRNKINPQKIDKMKTENKYVDEGAELAFPHIELDSHTGLPRNQHYGLTKRELFSAMVLQGCCADFKFNNRSSEDMAKIAVSYADALINELNKE